MYHILTNAISSTDPSSDCLLLPVDDVPSPEAGVRGLDEESLSLSLIAPLSCDPFSSNIPTGRGGEKAMMMTIVKLQRNHARNMQIMTYMCTFVHVTSTLYMQVNYNL